MTQKHSPKPAGSFVLQIPKSKAESPSNGEAEADKADKIVHTPISLSTDIEWARSGTRFYARPCADKFPILPGGVYRFVAPRNKPWFLERTAERFDFPFKIYNASGDIIKRICTHWAHHGGNLGVLMNGLRGAGKSVTAKLTANRLRDEMDLPILVIREPIPLDVVFDNVQQHMIVIFDEFEKSHDEDLYPGSQQRLLSTIDGMSGSVFNRLILFTTNSTDINENFKDRPSRIHYKFEFNRVADEIIEGLIDDGLPEHLIHFKEDIFQFLNTREICTIDIVRSVIKEVLAFEESPIQFEEMLNVAKGEPPSFTVSIVEENTNAVLTTLDYFFRLGYGEQRWSPLLNGNKRALEDFDRNGQSVSVSHNCWGGNITLSLLEACEDEDGYFLAKVSLPRRKTFYEEYNFLYDYSLWLDNQPKGWEPLPTAEEAKKDSGAREKVVERFNEARRQNSTLHGTGKAVIWKIRIESNHNKYAGPARHKATGSSAWMDLD